MRKAGEPLNAGKVAELTGLDRKVVDKAFADDYITQKLIQKWIEDEKAHMDWERQYLNYIDKLGYENFLIEMM